MLETRRRGGWDSWGGGVPIPTQLRGLGERREFPQRGPGRSPDRQRILGIFQGLRSLLVEPHIFVRETNSI